MTQSLPLLALSVRQPWAWAIIHAGKNVENRDWVRTNPGMTYRGPVAIHASQGMTRAEYDEAAAFMASIGVTCPPAIELQRGGIIGSVIVQDIVRNRDMPGGDGNKFSPWFFGPVGLLLRKPVACEFVLAKGALGFFKWAAGDHLESQQPARWMLPEQPTKAKQSKPEAQGTLL
ncbi:MAG: hypothetical protein HOO99_04120 [Hyphomicrobiaceae bacterium]|nr:hypothetical protein [Hyphomicrobiaceae bacterium]